VAFHPSGRRAATWDGGLLTLWDMESFSSVFEDNLGPYQSTGSALRFSPDGAHLWAWSAREDVHGLWTP
jgi:WD40 repeat protein